VETHGGQRSGLRRVLGVRLPLWGEMVFLALVIASWQAIRIPVEGSYSEALAHARDWLSVEQALHLDIEASVIRWAHEVDALEVLRWCYYNFHLPILFAFMALVRLLRPERYPFLRTAFVLSHIPAITVIALYPLLPPRWLPGMPHMIPAPENMNGFAHNATAAAASQHCGYPLMIAATIVWLAPRSRLAWLAFAYPAFVFLIVVSTGNHYTLDAIVGGLCIAFGFAIARLIHGPQGALRREPAAALGPAMVAAAGYAFLVRAIDTAPDLSLPPNPVNGTDIALIAGIGLILSAWLWSRSETGGRWERPVEPQPQDARSSA
jgi:hypothetical protein